MSLPALYSIASKNMESAKKLHDLDFDEEEMNSIAIRFWPKVLRLNDEECWIWQAYIDKKGYGRIRVRNSMPIASRISYALANGKIPCGAIICHKCDNPSCVNPAHLFAGSYQDNYDDMVKKGRAHKSSGERSGTAKLTDQQVKEIRCSKESLRKIAAKMGVTYGHVGKIKRGEWRL